MITRLFSVFDPSSTYISARWLTFFLLSLSLPLRFWNQGGGWLSFIRGVGRAFFSEAKPKTDYTSAQFFYILLLTIIVVNLRGLFPYIFSVRSHLTFTLRVALPLWSTSVLVGLWNSVEGMLAHLIPSGTPIFLASFITLVELVSISIRPITLSVRLAANIIAGHTLLALVGSGREEYKVAILGQLPFYALELAVACIQAYILITLARLYLRDRY